MDGKSESSRENDPSMPSESSGQSGPPQSGGEKDSKSTGSQEALEIETFVEESASNTPNRRTGLQSAAQNSVLSSRSDQTEISLRELLGVVGLIVLADLTIYRSHGFAGSALLFAASPVLLWISSPKRFRGPAFWITATMLVVLATKLIWSGSAGLVAIGYLLIAAYSMSLAGYCPYVLEALFYIAQIFQAGYLGIVNHAKQCNRLHRLLPQTAWIAYLLPLLALLAFGSLFIFANPNLAISFGERMQQFIESIHDWLDRFSPDLFEMAFWFATLWVVLGLLRPIHLRQHSTATSGNGHNGDQGTDATQPHQAAFLYPAYRNTLVAVIALFALYLVFEFQTLWFREFSDDFHYSGYAHQGAAWLTAALAMATAILSLVFRGSLLHDQRIGTLRRLAWLWSLENLILAAAVYNRLFIYIGFNGMSRMRIVGLYGMTAVLVGFVLVLWKIARNRNFQWLVRRHLWTLAIAVYLLAITPRDAIVVSYNVRRILTGDPAPCVQISVHPINAEGILLLKPLLDCEDEIIREGVRALLAGHHIQAETTASSRDKLGWTTYQHADRLALIEFRRNSGLWPQYNEPHSRQETLDQFHKYAYQWF